MGEVEIKFEREGLEGVIPIGSYVGDALRRFGIKDYERCNEDHDCVVEIVKGSELLSPMTSREIEYFGNKKASGSKRLACHARVEREGELVIMTKEEKREKPKAEESGGDKYRKQFAELPLDQKISELVKLEAIALGETVSFIINSPFAIFEKVGDIMADLGMKMENSARQAKRPAEHAEAAAGQKSKKTSTRKKSQSEEK